MGHETVMHSACCFGNEAKISNGIRSCIKIRPWVTDFEGEDTIQNKAHSKEVTELKSWTYRDFVSILGKALENSHACMFEFLISL